MEPESSLVVPKIEVKWRSPTTFSSHDQILVPSCLIRRGIKFLWRRLFAFRWKNLVQASPSFRCIILEHCLHLDLFTTASPRTLAFNASRSVVSFGGELSGFLSPFKMMDYFICYLQLHSGVADQGFAPEFKCKWCIPKFITCDHQGGVASGWSCPCFLNHL